MLNPSEYMSHDMFYHVMQRNLENMDEVYFDNNRRDRVIQDMIRKILVIVGNRSKKGEESKRFNGMVPASDSAMEVDEECMNDDCVICLEKIGKEELLCMPCLHI
ncbi:hypothetical protein RND71_003018 [Anisodus tanguticus]|uniref:Uncharacterized protein n=1 Tax=Anisodus tanguticus TaxID=243964 RepID=A0AAE1SV56_9SOLA|nr:hypothetical protein RND71_003018 [Anisodus tanguticus]